MASTPLPDPNMQPAESARKSGGRVRVKPRQLSPILKRVIVDSFFACRSTEDIAEELRIPARTVSDVLLLEALRKPMQPERGGAALPVVMQRRTA